MKRVTVSVILVFMGLSLLSQKQDVSNREMIAKAESFFEKENWQDALPLYAQLVSVYPENADYNFKYGVSVLMGDKSNSDRAIRHLTKAYQTKKGDKELLYYLGLAYYRNQQFAPASKFFFKSLELHEPGSPRAMAINELINACQRGLDLSHKNHLDEIQVKTEFPIDNFHRAYPADELEGSLIQKPDHFATQEEIQSGSKSFVYITEPLGTIYYSGYKDEFSDNRDIFVVSIDDEGNWGEPQPIEGQVNTNKDEAYPVMAMDGTVLFFSSKGHNSMGGYDVFKSQRDTVTGAFGPPENMGTGINSPFDDILFLPDKTGNGAIFASNRESKENNITVYKVSLNMSQKTEESLLAQAEENQSETPPELRGLARAEAHKKNHLSGNTGNNQGENKNEPAEEKTYGLVDPIAVSNNPGEIPAEKTGDPAVSVDKEPEKQVKIVSNDHRQETQEKPNKAPDPDNPMLITWELVYDDEEPIETDQTKQEEIVAVEEVVQPSNNKGEIRKEEIPVNYPEETITAMEPSAEYVIEPLWEIPVESTKEDIYVMQPAKAEFILPADPIQVPIAVNSELTSSELIHSAIEKPENLSYNELLYAASLAKTPEETLNIYYNSFIHIDRDWRAFYNAAVTALNSGTLDRAEVYLYQASLIYNDELMGQGSPDLLFGL